MNKTLITFYCLVLATLPARADPGQDAFWKQVSALVQNTTGISADEQLKALSSCYQHIAQYDHLHDSVHLLMLQKMADLYADKENFLHAIRFTKEAITLVNAQKGHPPVHTGNLVKCYYKLAGYYDALNQPAEKVRALENCIDIATKQSIVNPFYLYALWTRVKYLFDIGDYIRCIEYARIGEKDAVTLVNDTQHYYSIFLNFEINAELELNNFTAAEKLLSGKAALYRRTIPELASNIYEQSGRVELGRGNFAQALQYYSTALKNVNKHDSIRCLQVLENTGYYLYYKHHKDPRKALSYYFRALQFVKAPARQTMEEAQEALNLLSNIAGAYTEAGQYDSAFYFFQKAFDQVEPGMNEIKFANLPQGFITQYDRVWYITALMIDKGNAWLKMYKQTHAAHAIAAAMQVYKTADRVLARIRLEQSELASRLFWRNDSRRLYEQAIEAAYLTGDVTTAFYFFEKNRAVILDDQLLQQHFLNQENILEQAQLQRTIIHLKKEQQEGNLQQGIAESLFNNTRKLDRLQQQIKTKNPAYYQRYIDTSFITLQQAQQQLLDKDRVLVEIFNGDSAVYVLLAMHNNTTLRRLDKRDYENTVARYNTYLSDAVLLNKDHRGYIQTAYNLYLLLFGEKQIQQQRVIISPDGSYFPFESLITDNTAQDNYFIRNHAVSYTYSARYLLGESSPNISGNSLMGMAPVRYTHYTDLSDLPGSDESLARINRYFNQPHHFLFSNASRKNFLANFPQYNIIQLYTHAADSSEHGEPVIYFSDSVLYLSELIPENKPVTRLIVLSACETGNGNFYHGEGVFSFNRAFAATGIPAAVINLWAVDNGPTYKLTELFYKQLTKGLPADIALQKAKLEFLQNPSREATLPYYWAATVLTGKSDAVIINETYSWLQYLLLMAGTLGAFIAGRKYWKKNKAGTVSRR